ncbi:cation transporter [Rhodothermus profundi]|uniref:Copper chaperone n=1 Tax=Rhodothermus profundi TaxID=633813 RepID=A0A1M6VSS0_9BACT|nr:cation transporter [Rhodothermus profundi]SHK84375.1 copper chaperone [Rhodothermus profundi]
MDTTAWIVTLIGLAAMAWVVWYFWLSEPRATTPNQPRISAMKTQETLQIEGMSCQHCVHAVTNALKQLPGVEVQSVEIGRATVAYDPEQVSRDQIKAAIEAEGYTVAT